MNIRITGFLTRIPKLLAAILRNFLGINGFVEIRRIVKIRLISSQAFLLQALAQSHPLQHRSSGLRWIVGAALAGGFLCQVSAEPEGGRRGKVYDLRPNDMIEVKVFQEDDLNAVLRISKDGMVNFPLIGVVRVGGKSPQAAAATIRELLAKNYLVNPQVSVTVRDFSKQRFTVLGEVQKPGAYEMPDHDSISLLEAIGMAGGYTRIAEPGKITLKRVVNGAETVIKLNAKKMAKDKDSRSIDIKPGDVVTVGERFF